LQPLRMKKSGAETPSPKSPGVGKLVRKKKKNSWGRPEITQEIKKGERGGGPKATPRERTKKETQERIRP